MRKVYADIHWRTGDEGGRKNLPQVGAMYYPHISLDGKIGEESWSVRFAVTPTDDAGNSTICFSMLADNEGTKTFFKNLRVGVDFALLEGNMVVATGRIKQIAAE